MSSFASEFNGIGMAMIPRRSLSNRHMLSSIAWKGALEEGRQGGETVYESSHETRKNLKAELYSYLIAFRRDHRESLKKSLGILSCIFYSKV